ncbi:protein TonB [Breoghania corrubedonensis]|uniref:Protein TonB n=1 Tax=Breoghania corrubedonensis TaxID=665038 RepID=A0A2T5VCY0_9HYPH|nr:energy transducer TonB [Breoghania corrubedonensis]PTW61608.1 protein TonB [Breoghania corrubedonensis]
MRTRPLLLGCFAASFAIHLAVGAHYDFGGAPLIERSVSPGGEHARVGDMEDLFEGTNVSRPVEPLPDEEIKPVEEAPVEEVPVEEVTEELTEEAKPVEEAEIAEPQRVATVSPILLDDAEPVMPAPEVVPKRPEVPVEEILPDEQITEIEPEMAQPVEPESVVADIVTAPVPTLKPEVERPKREVTKKRVVKRSKPVKRGNSDRDQARGQSVGARTAERGDGGRKATSNYLGSVNARLQRAKHYPRRARGAEGVVRVSFTIARSGAVSGLRVVRSSGSAELDSAAMENVTRVSPFPDFPDEMTQKSQTVTVPFRYQAP